MGPTDFGFTFPVVERLVDTTVDKKMVRGIEPVLAEKVDDDPKILRITWHIRKGVTLHDGSPLDAELVRWNFQQMIDGKSFPYPTYLKGMRVIDRYTLVMDLTEYNNQLMPSWGFMAGIYSRAAWEKASGGDRKKGIEWARINVVSAGPFILKEYKRDSHLTYIRNPNYWRKGKPYLDGIEYRFIPEPATASAMMQVKEADVWEAGPAMQAELLKKGFKRQASWPALGAVIWINTANPKSKWQDKRLREALEYAIDKETIAKSLGHGFYAPLKSLPPPGEWGYDPTYEPRPYNPAKARQLLADAGYPTGLKVKALTHFAPYYRIFGVTVKQYLDAAGFEVNLDMADPGRFFGSIYGDRMPGIDEDIVFFMTGIETNYFMTYLRWLSTEPFAKFSYVGNTPEQVAMDKEAMKLTTLKEQETVTRKLVRYITDNALVIPIINIPAAVMQQPWVHSTYAEQGLTRWQTEDVRMEKH
jgi:ABC-type transport system substrate-binding protein